jgi:amicoumacin kinase
MKKVPEQVLHALSADFSVDGETLVQFGGGSESSDGIVYRFPWQDKERLIKVTAVPIGDGAAMRRMEERLKFVHFLGENGVRIVFPVADGQGKLLTTLEADGDIYIAYMMDKVSGSHLPPEQWTEEFFYNFGKTVGGLHRVTQLYPHWTSLKDETTGSVILGWEEEWQGFYEMLTDEEVRERWVSIRERMEKLPVQRDSFGFIHNDPHTYNILVDDADIHLLDFDVANFHWFSCDISIAMQEMLFDVTGGIERPVHKPETIRPTLDNFMRGYRTEHQLDDFWLDQLDLFISYRRILLWAVLQDFLRKKPDTKKSWKEMIMTEPPAFGRISRE